MRYIVIACVILASISAAAAEMTHEETMVRTAYAKFAYAVEQSEIGELASEANGREMPQKYEGRTSDQRLADARVSFALQDFVVGDVRSILQQKAIDLISPSVGEELSTGGLTENFNDRGLATSWKALVASWQPAKVLPPEVMAVTIDQLYELQWQQQRPDTLWQRYASYSVTVSYRGKSRGPYKALFLFGHDASGNEVVEPEDSTVSVTGLAYALHEPLFPESFVLTRMRNFPVVSDWLSAGQMPGSCSQGHGDVCCDLMRLHCGPGRDDIAAGLNKPEPGITASKQQ